MPRSPTVLTPPPGTLPFVPNTTIESGKANAVWLDLYQDGNTPRPIEYGGTGASTATDALNNLGAVGQSNLLDAFSIGDFTSTVRTLDSLWLRRNGALYDVTDYPDLAALLPPLPNGIIFDPISIGSTNGFLGITKSGSTYAMCGGSGLVYTSTDKATWFTRDTGTTNTLRFIIEGSGIYLSGGSSGVLVKSADLETWGPASVSDVNILNGGIYTGSRFIVVGAQTGSPRIAYSSDSNSWTTITPSGSAAYNDLATNATTIVAVGGAGQIITSTDDGTSWTPRTSGTSAGFYAVSWDAFRNIFIACGTGGVVATSPEGISWTLRSTGTTQTLYAVAASESGISIVGASGSVVISTNGTNYTSVVSGASSQLNGIIYDDEPFQFVVCGNNGFLSTMLVTNPSKFRVPNDSPQYGWIKARND